MEAVGVNKWINYIYASYNVEKGRHDTYLTSVIYVNE
jgi:hypothetical protein